MMPLQEIVLWVVAAFALGVVIVAVVVTSGVLTARLMARNDEMDEYQARIFHGFRASWSRRSWGLVLEIAIASFDMALRILWTLRILPRMSDPGSGTPIVLLPGYTENAGAMWWIARRLRRRGFRPILVDFPSTFSSIQRNVSFLRQKLQAICKETGQERVAVVAHSMGGVVTRALLLSDPNHPVLTLIALSSPFRGTHIAKLGVMFHLGESVIDMSPGSPFGHMFLPSARVTARVHCIIGEQENIVSPPWSIVLPDHDVHLMSLPVGHDAPLFLRESFDCIERWLVQDGVLRAQAPAKIQGYRDNVVVLRKPQSAQSAQHDAPAAGRSFIRRRDLKRPGQHVAHETQHQNRKQRR